MNIRHQVFTLEQRIDSAKDFDGRDTAPCTLLLEIDGAYVATGRMLPDGHIGRLAVLKPWRCKGAGRLIIETLISEASRMGLERVFLGAQKPAAGFYKRIGFHAFGPSL